MAMLRRLLPPGGTAARFEDDSLRVGVVDMPGRRVVCLFNWEAVPRPVEVRLDRPSFLRDFWTDADLGRHHGRFEILVPAHGARLLVATPG
jgi:hypothetical protein